MKYVSDSFPVDEHDFNLRFGQDDWKTEAVVTYRAWSVAESRIIRLVARGLATRHPEDPQSPGVGMSIALARALEDLAGQVRARVLEVGGFEFD